MMDVHVLIIKGEYTKSLVDVLLYEDTPAGIARATEYAIEFAKQDRLLDGPFVRTIL